MAGKKQTEEQVARFADMSSALGTEPRLRIMRLLLSAHPDGMVVGDITPTTALWTAFSLPAAVMPKRSSLRTVRPELTLTNWALICRPKAPLRLSLPGRICSPVSSPRSPRSKLPAKRRQAGKERTPNPPTLWARLCE